MKRVPHSHPLPPGEITPQLRQLAEETVLSLWAALRVTRYHATDNDAVLNALKHLRQVTERLFRLQFDVSVLYYGRDFYMNEVRVHATPTSYEHFEAFAELLSERQIGGIRFTRPPILNALARLVKLLTETGPDRIPYRVEQIAAQLERSGIHGIELTPIVVDEPEDLPEIDRGTFTRQAYFSAISTMRGLLDQAGAHRPLALTGATRVVQNLVDIVCEDAVEPRLLLVLLAQVKNHHGYLANHSVNRCVLAVAFARELGLEPPALRELGTAALLADVGCAQVPAGVLETASPLEGRARIAMTEHTLRGFVAVTAWQQLDRLMIKAALAATSHHRHVGAGGYPKGLPEHKGFFQHVVAICDRYDALTTPRPFRASALTRGAALYELATRSGTVLHPVVVKPFAHWIAGLPHGTVVVTDSGEIGLALHPASDGHRAEVSRALALLDGPPLPPS